MIIRFFGDVFPVPGIKLDDSLAQADLTVFNLESPLTDSATPIVKAGPNLSANPEDFAALVAQFPGKVAANLANNHLGDFGAAGIADTLAAAQKLNVLVHGVSEGGSATAQELTPGIVWLNFCEEQFGLSQPGRLGVIPHNWGITKQIRQLKAQGQKVIISSHLAEEMWPWPSPWVQDYFRALIDCGADLIYNHHSHVPQGYEIYQSKPIIYGLGNFVVDYSKWRENVNTRWSVFFDYDTANEKLTCGACQVDAEQNISVIALPQPYWRDALAPLSDRKLLTALWQEYSLRIFDAAYYPYLWGQGDSANIFHLLRHWGKVLIKKLQKKSVWSPAEYALKYHLFSAESHRQAIKTALGLRCGEIVDVRTPEAQVLADKYFVS